jgi:hypothetical protein
VALPDGACLRSFKAKFSILRNSIGVPTIEATEAVASVEKLTSRSEHQYYINIITGTLPLSPNVKANKVCKLGICLKAPNYHPFHSIRMDFCDTILLLYIEQVIFTLSDSAA